MARSVESTPIAREIVIEFRDTLSSILKMVLDDQDDEQQRPLSAWLEETSNNLKPDAMTLYPQTYSSNMVASAAKLFALLRDALLSHRWSEVTELLVVLIKEATHTMPTVFKVGLEVFHHDDLRNHGRLEQFVSHLKLQPMMIINEIILQQVFALLLDGRFDDARQVCQRSTKVTIARLTTPRAEDFTVLFTAYTGVALYGCWLKANHQLQHMQQQTSEFYRPEMATVFGAEDEEEMKMYAERAITAFGCLRGKKGVWDIFTEKHIALLEYYDQKDEALAVLTAENETNPDNAHTLRLLHAFYQRHEYSQTAQLTTLQSICRLVPSDPLVLQLYSLTSTDAGAVTLLFDLLDFACWRDDPSPWHRLADHLTLTYTRNSSEGFAEVDKCWTDRATWWPTYHFSPITIDQSNVSLLLHKAVCVILLSGKGDYTDAVDSHLTDPVCKAQLQEVIRLREQRTENNSNDKQTFS